MFKYQDYVDSAKYIQSRIAGFQPEVLIILGSGLGFLGDEVENPIIVPYGDIPNFKVSTAPGHKGQFVFGTLNGKKVMAMQGRMHHYEGYSAYEVTVPVRVAKLLGVHSMIVTNACGGINTGYHVGDLMIIKDHIKFFDLNPVLGENIEEFGPRFFDMSYTYNKEYRSIAKNIGEDIGIRMQEGVYYYFTGPQFETPAEIRAMRILGADVCGMSTVPEVIAAHHCGIKILGISLITNMAAGVLDQKIDGDEVIREANKAKDGFSKLILKVLPELKG